MDTHALNTHSHTHTHTSICMSILISFSLFSLLLLRLCLLHSSETEGSFGALTQSIISKGNKSNFPLPLLLSPSSLFFRLHTVFKSLSLFLPFFLFPHNYIIFSLSTLSFFFPPPVSSVWGGNSLCILLWANKMTHCFLITSALFFSPAIILLVSTT